MRRKPQVAPDAVTMALFGPGVADIETANAVADASQAKPSTATRSCRTAPRAKSPRGTTMMQAAPHSPPASTCHRYAGTKRGRKRTASTAHDVSNRVAAIPRPSIRTTAPDRARTPTARVWWRRHGHRPSTAARGALTLALR